MSFGADDALALDTEDNMVVLKHLVVQILRSLNCLLIQDYELSIS